MRSTAAIASGLSMMRRRVSLSTFTSSADSHLRASSVAEVPAIASVENAARVNLRHVRAVVGQHGAKTTPGP